MDWRIGSGRTYILNVRQTPVHSEYSEIGTDLDPAPYLLRLASLDACQKRRRGAALEYRGLTHRG
jgi:hypothetical protein